MAASPRSAKPAARPAKKAGSRSTVRPEDVRPAQLVLISGAEGVLADRAIATVLARAREAAPELEVTRLEAQTYETGRLAQVSSPSLFGGDTLIIVEGVEALNDAFATDVVRYARDPAPDVVLVLRHAGGQRGKAMLDAVRAAGAVEVECLPLTKDDEKAAFVDQEVRRAGRRISPQAVRLLVEAIGSDLRELAAAAAQLAEMAELAGTGGGPIEAATVETWFGGRHEVTAFKVADAAVAGAADEALGLLRHAFATGADPVPLVAALALKVRSLAKVSDAGRARSSELAGDLGMAPWQIDRARRDLAGWSEDGLAAAVTAVARADAEVKGAGRDPRFAVERAVLTIAQARD